MGTTQSTSPIASKRSASEMAANEEEIGRKRATAIASSFNIEAAAAAAARVGTFNVEASDAASASVAALAFIIGARDYPKEEDSASAGETFNFEADAAPPAAPPAAASAAAPAPLAAAAPAAARFHVEASGAASTSAAALDFIFDASDDRTEEDSASAGETFNFETSAAAGAAARVGTFHVEASDAASASAAALAFIIGARDDRTEEDSASAGETFNIKAGAGAGAAVAVAAVATDDDVASTFFFDHEDRQGAAEGATAEAANDLTNAAVDQHEVTVAQVTEQFTIACKYLVDSGLALFLSSAIGGQADTSRVQTYMARTTGFAQFAYERVSMHFIVTNLV